MARKIFRLFPRTSVRPILQIKGLAGLAAFWTPIGFSANHAISTYFKVGFTPAAIASDRQGNIYMQATL